MRKPLKPSLTMIKNTFLLFLSLIFVSCHSKPSFNFGSYSEAEQLYEKGEYEKAIGKYEKYIHENPEGNMAVIATYYMAKSYEATGRYEKARELYEKIVKEHPDVIWVDFAKDRLQELSSQSSVQKSSSSETALKP